MYGRQMRFFVLLALALCAVASCDDEDDHEHASSAATCGDLADICHAYVASSRAAFDCHELAHHATEADCAAKRPDCLAVCSGPLDAGSDVASE